nr:MAG TPA: hypothetical protein [Inoviridae sp.]
MNALPTISGRLPAPRPTARTTAARSRCPASAPVEFVAALVFHRRG